jgi:pimeloyl-ACP methyl ester carboxylesterase
MSPMRDLTWGEFGTSVVDEGQGTPVLFLHGVPDSAHTWSQLIAGLSQRFRCIAPDLHGLGASRAPREFDLSLDARARWLDGLLAALEADGPALEGPVDLVCHDFGGPTALAWAVRNPDRVRRLVIMATCFHREWQWHKLGRLYRKPVLGKLAAAMQTAPGIGPSLFRSEMRRGSRGLSDDYIREIYGRITRDVARQTVRLYRQTPSSCFEGWDSELYRLVDQRPTLAIWSSLDPYVPLEFAHKLAEHGAELCCFDDVGHWMHIEASERVLALLQRFLGPDPDA